jgi:outer membrane protein assembly factor BamB
LKWNFRAPHAPVTAWHKTGEELPRMHFDNCYHVVSGNGFTYFGSSVDDQLYALDSQTGQLKWTFFAEGPIRFAPSLQKNRLYFGADDGLVYCLNAQNGKLIWKFRAGPSDKKVLGNGRLISLWPVRTSVLVQDDVVYFGAGIFPYEGLYICALDADNGKILWKNDTVGDEAFELQFGGISPHGYLLASNEILYVPSGRAMPAAFDRKTGEFRYSLSPGSKVGGTWGLICDDLLIAGVESSGTPAKIAYNLATGQRQGDLFASFDGIDLVTTAAVSFVLTGNGIDAIDRVKFPEMKNELDSLLDVIEAQNRTLQKTAAMALESKTTKSEKLDKLISKIEALKMEQERLQTSTTRWQYCDSLLSTLILAGNKIVAGGKGHISVLDVENGKLLQQFKIEGTALGLAAADGCLLATTETGQIYCFGAGDSSAAETIAPAVTAAWFENDQQASLYQTAAAQILKITGVSRGYCLVLDAGEGRLCFEIAKQSELQVIGIEADPKKVNRARENLEHAGIYGSRVVLGNWDLSGLPDYCANLIVSDQFLLTGKINAEPAAVHRLLKPFGGMACFGQVTANEKAHPIDETNLLDWLKKVSTETPVFLRENGYWAHLTRGALEGAGGWTHQYSNPANTACSDDQIVAYPLGVLWFGEPGPEKMVERHARATAPVAKNGRMFVQGENVVLAFDAYNGLKLWEREIPGANRVRVDVDGGNLALSDAGVLVATGDQCLLLDVATGKTLRSYSVPAAPDGKPRRWAYVACSGGTLFGSAGTPLAHEYNYLSHQLEMSDQNKIAAFFASQFQSKAEAQQDFQRSGAKWHFIADFPAWDGGIVTEEPATDKLMFSDAVFAVDIQSGRTKWVHRGKQIAHITISINNGWVHFADTGINPTQKSRAIADRRVYFQTGVWKTYAEPIPADQTDVRLVTVLDSETGAKKWERPVDLSGCGGDAVASACQKNVLLFFGSFGLHDKWRFPAGELKWHRVTALSSSSGEMLWSRPLNYMVRPVIVGDEIIVEPRACNLFTGEIKTRTHPITGKTVPWEYYRPGHTCAVTSASSNCLFYRSYNAAFYDLAADRGITNRFQLANSAGVTEFGYIFSGFLTVPQNGIYTFYLESNDGSKLFIRGRQLIDNDGGHGALEKSGQIPLQTGKYPLVVKYFQMGGGQALKVSWESAGFSKREITDEVVGVGE